MKITFFTTTTYSDIQDKQSMCIKKFFPNSKQILIDGRGRWFDIWYRWLEIANGIDSDWFVHIDEDCFITSADGINSLIDDMNKNNFDIAGTPDGCHEYRSGNHMALNSFFMILNKNCVNTWKSRTNVPQFKSEWIREYPFNKNNISNFIFDMEFGSSGKPISQIWRPNSEPYYDFMWVLMDNSIKFKYIEPIFDSEFQTTNILNNTIIHMWHQRERNCDYIVSTAHTMSNKERFDGILKKIGEIL